MVPTAAQSASVSLQYKSKSADDSAADGDNGKEMLDFLILPTSVSLT